MPLVRLPQRRRSEGDARFTGDYPPEWGKCQTCGGAGSVPGDAIPLPAHVGAGETVLIGFDPGGSTVKQVLYRSYKCPDCFGMGSLKARVRLEAGHRCLRCKHPYVPKVDAKKLGVEPSWRGEGWSPCDERCEHGGPLRRLAPKGWEDVGPQFTVEDVHDAYDFLVEAAWRILTVHHLDGDKANVRWWNLVSLCQRCHLEIQAKVVMERVYPHEHAEWFKPFVAGYYAFVYLCSTCGRNTGWVRSAPFMHPPGAYVEGLKTSEGIPVENLWDYPHKCESGLEVTREEVEQNLDRLLALERAA